MAEGPPYGIEYMRTDLLYMCLSSLTIHNGLVGTTDAMDGMRPMTEKPMPKTSRGVKLRFNSAWIEL